MFLNFLSDYQLLDAPPPPWMSGRTFYLSHNHILVDSYQRKQGQFQQKYNELPLLSIRLLLISPFIALICPISQVIGWDACLTVVSADWMKQVWGATPPIKMHFSVIRQFHPAGVLLTWAQNLD